MVLFRHLDVCPHLEHVKCLTEPDVPVDVGVIRTPGTGTGTSEAGGVSSREVVSLLRDLPGLRIVGSTICKPFS